MPWETLELDANTATARDVEAAFARKLAALPPEANPEAAAKLRAAHEYALKHTEWRDRNRPAAVEAPAAEAAASFPEIAALRAALVIAAPEIPDLVRQAEQALYARPGEVIPWGGEMRRLFDQYGGNASLALKPEALLFELEHAGHHATFAVIERLDRQGRVAGIAGLGDLLLENQPRISNAGGALAAMRLACADAVWVRSALDSLQEFAKPHLSPQQWQALKPEMDRCEKLGRTLEGIPEEWRLFWRDRLQAPAGSGRWDDPGSVAALKALRSSEAQRWPSLLALRDCLPPEVAAQVTVPAVLPSRLNRASSSGQQGTRATLPESAERRVRRRTRTSGGGGGGYRGGSGSKNPLRIALFAASWVVYIALKAWVIAHRRY
ncbi:MAG: hypothetical protein JWO82_1884 [Akkermansiaceae bacterium]|nr:hypothetical protein [Akkermansiaceae bacterium]